MQRPFVWIVSNVPRWLSIFPSSSTLLSWPGPLLHPLIHRNRKKELCVCAKGPKICFASLQAGQACRTQQKWRKVNGVSVLYLGVSLTSSYIVLDFSSLLKTFRMGTDREKMRTKGTKAVSVFSTCCSLFTALRCLAVHTQKTWTSKLSGYL